MKGVDHLIINSPYEEPKSYWFNDAETQSFKKLEGRRPAGYFISDPKNPDAGIYKELDLVNLIRPRVSKWRELNYPNITGVTRKLLDHWKNPDREQKFFFCQMEAIETLIWFVEARDEEKVGIDVPSDGGSFLRRCVKLCTGGGKTTVMAMLIAWQVLNKVSYPQDKRFSKNVFVVAPNLTVKSRLAVLRTDVPDNYYSKFNIVPNALRDKLPQGKVVVRNWQSLAWDDEDAVKKKHSVDKRGVISNEAYARSVLGEIAHHKDLIVINDEAHHAWRVNPSGKYSKDEKEEATVWVGGLDKINETREIRMCYDFSATPFSPSGKKNDEEALYPWIVSDFGLNDGIESGLVKTPRLVIRDDGQLNAETYKSRLYHIYSDPEVKDDLTRKDADKEDPLNDLILMAYKMLGYDWKETYNLWKQRGSKVPPVMMTVANKTVTADRISNMFDSQSGGLALMGLEDLCNKETRIQIDSGIIDSKGTKEGSALREVIDTVGKIGKPGEQIRNVISVGMLTEGWDANNVTHIMGLRAFSSQLLCEQIVGRGLRRMSYEADENGFFRPEYVNIFGIPFTFLPHESDEGNGPTTEKPKTLVSSIPERSEYEIHWPNVLGINRKFGVKLSLDPAKISRLRIKSDGSITVVRMGAANSGGVSHDIFKDIDRNKAEIRIQTLIFNTAMDVYKEMDRDSNKPLWQNNPYLIGQITSCINEYIVGGNIEFDPDCDEEKFSSYFIDNLNRIVRHIWESIRSDNTEEFIPVIDSSRPVMSTLEVGSWYTSKRCLPTHKSQISHCIFDSSWEDTEEFYMERSEDVLAFVKNDEHVGFQINYIYNGANRIYYPDFLIKLKNGKMLVLEVKGKKDERVEIKREYLQEWIKAVNDSGEYGEWCEDMSLSIKDIGSIIKKHST